jgi:hypothetical protein
MDDGYKSANGFYFCAESYSLENESYIIIGLVTNKEKSKSLHAVQDS